MRRALAVMIRFGVAVPFYAIGILGGELASVALDLARWIEGPTATGYRGKS